MQILFFLTACCFAAACEKEKAQMLMNMLNIPSHPDVLFLSGFGKLNVCFLLCFSWSSFRKIPRSEGGGGESNVANFNQMEEVK